MFGQLYRSCYVTGLTLLPQRKGQQRTCGCDDLLRKKATAEPAVPPTTRYSGIRFACRRDSRCSCGWWGRDKQAANADARAKVIGVARGVSTSSETEAQTATSVGRRKERAPGTTASLSMPHSTCWRRLQVVNVREG